MRRLRTAVIGLCAALVFMVAASGAGWWWLQAQVSQPLGLSEPGPLLVDRGSSVARVAYDLHDQGLLDWPQLAILHARLSGQTDIKSGEYQVNSTLTWVELCALLVSGEVIDHQVTLVEGWDIAQALTQLQSHPAVEATLDGAFDPRLLAILPSQHNHPEGWFLANTYHFQRGDSDLSILTRAHAALVTELDQLWPARDVSLPLDSPYAALTLASIVEKETGLASERPIIAGVFIRRLRQNMRLQTDPTVIYGLGDTYQGNITRAHLRQATDYNTYVIKGLPPTPIALVGADALTAVFNPDDGNALYFVARGDGSHQFSATLDEHNQAVQHYQINNRPSNYRSSPAQGTQ